MGAVSPPLAKMAARIRAQDAGVLEALRRINALDDYLAARERLAKPAVVAAVRAALQNIAQALEPADPVYTSEEVYALDEMRQLPETGERR